MGYPDNAALERLERLRVHLWERFRVSDARSDKKLGFTRVVTVKLEPWSPVILKLEQD